VLLAVAVAAIAFLFRWDHLVISVMVTIGFMGSDLFVGRSAELGVLHEALAEVKAGVGGVVLVVGEQGVGKSSLLRAGLGEAEDQGCRLAWGVADELGQRIPLWLMDEVLAGAAETPAGEDVAVAARVERCLAEVDRLCAQSPLVLVAEDLQWADEASLLVWHRLTRAVIQLPLLLAGSCRPDPGADVLRLRRGVTDRDGSVLDLGPLADGEVRELAGALAGGRPGHRLTELARRAGGNPLYARELVDGLMREGRVRVSGGQAELAGGMDSVRVPVSLAAAIASRLGSLPDDALRVLRWAALLGHEFSVTDLEVVSGQSAGDLMPVIDAATGAGVLTEAGTRLGFRHGLIRQALYEGMPAGLRAALHLQAARMLAGARAAPERVAAQLMPAELDQEAGGQEATLPADDWVVAWLAEAAPALIYRAPEMAENLLAAVLGQLPGSDGRRAVLEANLAAVLFRLERYEEAERAGVRLLAGDTDPQRVADTAWLVAYAMMRTGRLAQAVPQITRALAQPGLSASQTARLRALRAITLNTTGQYDQAEIAARQALTEAEQAGDRLSAAYALHALATVSFSRRQEAARLDYIDRALALIEIDPQATDLRLLLLTNKAFHLTDADRHTEAVAMARQALALAERAGTPRVYMVRSTLGELHFEAGEWDDALSELDAAPSAALMQRLRIHGMRALIAAHRGDRETTARHLRTVEDENLMAGASPASWVFLRLAKSLAAEQDGHLTQAEAVLAECFEPGIAEQIPGIIGMTVPLARLALARGDREAAELAARQAETEAEREPAPLKVAIAKHCRGLVDGELALVLAAADYFLRAGRGLYRAQSMEDAAVVAAQRDELATAQQYLAEAIGAYAKLGAAWDIQRTGARLLPYGLRAARAAFRGRPASGWEALTPTEVKVAYLVADGRSNPDVAAALFLSRNTVQTHVSHILAKLGARSRAEIIREAVRHPAARPAAAV
jgi:DNA-binding CsgD family transcriptional regulator/tetratricopeptide (TPR) repeat protein